MSAQPFDPIADLRTAVEQIKREPKPQPDMVPWVRDEGRTMRGCPRGIMTDISKSKALDMRQSCAWRHICD